ncbi:thermonuclease family protein [Shinella sp.]|uniref:thermonuclease family protein n=1 Tax=Shinella sp. TaxID=1870904 RepID=UPI003F723789
MMRKAIITAIVTGAAYAASLAIPLSAGSSLRVIDGDTLEMNGETVRIANIDTPETKRAEYGGSYRLIGLNRSKSGSYGSLTYP